MTGKEPIIRLRGLAKSFDNTTVLQEVNLDIHDGEFITLLGPSGCGKTTLLRLIAGFESPTTGDVFIHGQKVNDTPPNKRRVNTVFQSYALFPHMTVSENLAFGLNMSGVPRSEIAPRVEEALDMVDLSGMGDRKPHQLSGGQQQRVAIARAVINRPHALLLDEPLSALDARLRKHMQMQLKQLCRELGTTFVFVTHDQEEAFAMSDRIVVMNNGHIEQVGTPEEVYEEPASMYVARFVGETCIFEGVTKEPIKGGVQAEVEGVKCELRTSRSFAPGTRVNVILRPEDILVEAPAHIERPEAVWLHGYVTDTVYKGSTWDMLINLDCGKDILVTEFFNEDDERIWHRPGDRVKISWYKGWEVVLPHADNEAL